MTLVGAWDAATGKVLQEFSPVLTARAGFGVRSSLIDSKGTLWVGGDLNYSLLRFGLAVVGRFRSLPAARFHCPDIAYSTQSRCQQPRSAPDVEPEF